MSENVQGKSGPFSWLNKNFEKIFMVTGLLAIILFITWQVIYRYIITQFIERAGAAVWTALGNEFFAAKARNAIAAFAALNLNAGFVNEFHLNTVRKKLSQSQPFEGRFEQHNEKSPARTTSRQGFFTGARRRFHGTRRLN